MRHKKCHKILKQKNHYKILFTVDIVVKIERIEFLGGTDPFLFQNHMDILNV